MSINKILRTGDTGIRDTICSFLRPQELAQIEPTSQKVHQFIGHYRTYLWSSVQNHPFIQKLVQYSPNFHRQTPKKQLVLIDHIVKVAKLLRGVESPVWTLFDMDRRSSAKGVETVSLYERDPFGNIASNLHGISWGVFLAALAQTNHFEVLHHVDFKMVERDSVDVISGFCLKNGQLDLFNKILQQTSLYNINGLVSWKEDVFDDLVILAAKYGHWDIFESLIEKRENFRIEDNDYLVEMIRRQKDDMYEEYEIPPNNLLMAIALFYDKMRNINGDFIDHKNDSFPSRGLHWALSVAANLELVGPVQFLMSKITDIRILEQVRDQYAAGYSESRILNEPTLSGENYNIHEHPEEMFNLIDDEILRRLA